jgi:hypothetical protein
VGTRLYLDGLLVAVGDAPMLGSNGLPLQIGGNPEVPDNTFYGLIDEVAVWSRAMDEGEVRRIWNNGEGALVPFLIAGIDSDGDGMSDVYENAHGLNPALNDAGLDSDGDTLSNITEHDAGSHPGEPDTDGDGLRDDAELAAGTSTLTPDTDGDGLTDGEELTEGADGYITNPLNPNTDGDNWSDGDEANAGTDPTDPDDFPLVTRITSLGTGTGALLRSDLTDPENDGVDAANTNWNWVRIQSSTKNAFGTHEGAYNIFDNKVGGGQDKWCCDAPPQSIWVEFEQAYRLTHFTLASANDVPDRDPIFWSIQGSNDGVNWDIIYPEIHPGPGMSLWPQRLQVLQFDLPAASKPYKFFKYDCQQTVGGVNHQIGELELFGFAAPATAENVVITKVAFAGATLELTTEGMSPGGTYELRRSLDAQDFSTVVGDPFTGADTNVFVDPSPPAGTALYQIWSVDP